MTSSAKNSFPKFSSPKYISSEKRIILLQPVEEWMSNFSAARIYLHTVPPPISYHTPVSPHHNNRKQFRHHLSGNFKVSRIKLNDFSYKID